MAFFTTSLLRPAGELALVIITVTIRAETRGNRRSRLAGEMAFLTSNFSVPAQQRVASLRVIEPTCLHVLPTFCRVTIGAGDA